MAQQNTPEPGTRCRVKTSKGEEYAIWTGHMWYSEDNDRIIDGSEVLSWTEAPH